SRAKVWRAAARIGGAAGWRVGVGWASGLCAAAGAGVLLSAMTMEPPRPPQPKPQAIAPQAMAPQVARAEEAEKAGKGLGRAEPTKIEIPAIGVSADLLSLGVDQSNELAVPPLERADLASWYNLGPSPGEPGSAVVVGHVDSQKTGPAVFFNLGTLNAGDLITVPRKDGSRPAFKVDSVQSFLKTEFPTRMVYEGEKATLRVITCGGEFDKKNRNYLSNVVVFASYFSP
ncbi:MAG TPA: class F sortase, partial [Candidatus Limnocylindrales bacterium]